MSKKKKNLKKERKDNKLLSIITALKSVKNNMMVKNIDLFENDFQRIIDRLNDDSFRLAVVGEFSSGKSTFLNALIGKDLLKHGAKETTATITEIHNKQNVQDDIYLDVYFRDGSVIQEVSADKITEYTATASSIHAVAEEIDRVVINSNILDSDSKVCFVDTPGLNGVADNHREKTIEQIKNAHACIYLMQVRGLGQSDIDFLKYIIKYQHNIIFVQNFIDELKRLEGETPEQKVEQQRKIIEEKVISENENVHYEIIAVSSRKALIAKASEFKVYNDEILSEEMRERLYVESRFDDVLSVINELMVNNEKEKIQQKDTIAVALKLLEQLRMVVSFKNEQAIEEWGKTIDGRNSTNYSNLIQSLMANKDGYIKKLDDYIESETAEIRRKSNKDIEIGISDIEDSIKEIFSDISTISEFDEYVKNRLTAYLYESVTDVDELVVKNMNIRFENVVTNAVLRIRQYTGAEVKGINPDNFEATSIELNVKSFAKEENEITKLQRELSEKKALNEKAKSDIQNKKSQISKLNSDIEAQKRMFANLNANKNSEISRLGAMPEKEIKYRRETYYEYRGGFGILDALFGPKEKTRSVSYTDDSKQQVWRKQKSDIETKYREKENQINSQCRILETKKRQCDEEIKHLERTDATRKNSIQSTQNLLTAKIEYLNNQREKVKQEYLREAKKSMLENIHEYLHEYILDMLYENNEIAIKENFERVNCVVKPLFAIAFENRISILRQRLDEVNGNKKFENSTELLSIIDDTMIKLEEFLCQ